MTSGSSCYLASMSSADFDDCPISVGSSHRFLTTSLSEADETEYLSTENPTKPPQNQEVPTEVSMNEALPKSSVSAFVKAPAVDHSKGSIVQGIPAAQGRQGKGHFQEKMRLRTIFQRKQQQAPTHYTKHQHPNISNLDLNQASNQQLAEIESIASSGTSKERKKTLYPKTKLTLPGKGNKDCSSLLPKLSTGDDQNRNRLNTQDFLPEGPDLTPLPSPLPASLLGDVGAVPPSPGVLTVIERKLPLPRSRIGTTTSQDTSIDQTTLIENSGVPDSFEEELFRGLSRDEDNETQDLMMGKIYFIMFV